MLKILILTMLFFDNPPLIDGWEKVTETNYEIKNTVKMVNENITITSMLGLMQIFKNPESKNELVFVVSKYPSTTFIPQNMANKEVSRDEMLVAENYFKKTRQEKLKEASKLSDKILVVQWSEELDNRTGEKMLVKPIKNWLLKPNGQWMFEESREPKIKIELISEELGEKSVLIGFKFSLGENYHILRFDQNQLGGVQ